MEHAEFVDEAGRGFHRVVGMNADGGEDVRVFLRERDRAPAALDACADGDDARDARIRRAREDAFEIVREVGEGKVRVGVGEHGGECGMGGMGRIGRMGRIAAVRAAWSVSPFHTVRHIRRLV